MRMGCILGAMFAGVGGGGLWRMLCGGGGLGGLGISGVGLMVGVLIVCPLGAGFSLLEPLPGIDWAIRYLLR